MSIRGAKNFPATKFLDLLYGESVRVLMSYVMTSHVRGKFFSFSFSLQMLQASLFIAENLPDGPSGLWAVIHAECFSALGELEWIPFPVMRKALDINVLGEFLKRRLGKFSVTKKLNKGL